MKETVTEVTQATPARTTNKKLLAWVEEVAQLTRPESIHWCDGSAEEYEHLCRQLVDAGTFEKLADAKRPSSYLARSDPADVARVEDRTFICSEREADADLADALERLLQVRGVARTHVQDRARLAGDGVAGRVLIPRRFNGPPASANVNGPTCSLRMYLLRIFTKRSEVRPARGTSRLAQGCSVHRGL